MELLRRVREFSAIPVIFLTSKDDELDEALGLAMGADDYISKPFSQRLLIARIRALLRRQELARGEAAATSEQPEQPLLERGRLVMDPDRHKVQWDGRDVTLTVTEFLILEALAQRPGRGQDAQPVARHRLSRGRLRRRPDDRQPHQADPKEVPRRRPRIRCDRDPLWRRIPFRRPIDEESDLALSWSGRWTLAHRILAVNVLTLVLLALAVLYLDSYRNRLSRERIRQTRVEAMTTAAGPVLPQAKRVAAAARVDHPANQQPDADLRLRWPPGHGQLAGDRADLPAEGPGRARNGPRMSPGRSTADSTRWSGRGLWTISSSRQPII